MKNEIDKTVRKTIHKKLKNNPYYENVNRYRLLWYFEESNYGLLGNSYYIALYEKLKIKSNYIKELQPNVKEKLFWGFVAPSLQKGYYHSENMRITPHITKYFGENAFLNVNGILYNIEVLQEACELMGMNKDNNEMIVSYKQTNIDSYMESPIIEDKYKDILVIQFGNIGRIMLLPLKYNVKTKEDYKKIKKEKGIDIYSEKTFFPDTKNITFGENFI